MKGGPGGYATGMATHAPTSPRPGTRRRGDVAPVLRNRPAASRRGTDPGVLGRMPSMEAARSVLEALENSGIDGNDLALLGPAAEQAAHSHDRHSADRRLLQLATRRVAVGSALGVVAGTVLAGVVVLVELLITPSIKDHPWALGMIILAWSFLGAVVGVFFSIERGVSFSDSWQLALHDVPASEVWVAVFGAHAGAEDVLAEHGATDIRHPSPRGRDLARTRRTGPPNRR